MNTVNNLISYWVSDFVKKFSTTEREGFKNNRHIAFQFLSDTCTFHSSTVSKSTSEQKPGA
jgi:hypothetical protein